MAGQSDQTRPAPPFVIGIRRELFVDDYLVDRSSSSVEFRLHRPVETNDVFVHDTPWEGNRSMYVTIFRDGDIYRMYYRGSEIAAEDGNYTIPYNVTCYAESRDGIHWKRPELNLVPFRGSTQNNIILSGEVSRAFVPFKDANPDCKSEHRYKVFVAVYRPVRGLHAYSSPDGIHWNPLKDRAVITTGYFDSQNLAFWDSNRSCYVSYHRALRGGPGMIISPSHEGSTKDVMTATSQDFVEWTEPVFLEYSYERWTRFSSKPTPVNVSPYIQLYTSQIQTYHRAPQIYLGFPTRYVANRKKLTAFNRHLSEGVEYFGTDYTDSGFIAGHDGQRFQFWDEALVRPDIEEKGRWVYGDNFQALGIIETESRIEGAPNELSIYVNENFWREPRLRRYRLRLDGFVSARAGVSGGELITKSLVMDGKELELNMASSAVGSITVEIQFPDGRPVEGYELENCDELFADKVSHTVKWHQGADVTALAGKAIRLRFRIRDADLYAFRFRP